MLRSIETLKWNLQFYAKLYYSSMFKDNEEMKMDNRERFPSKQISSTNEKVTNWKNEGITFKNNGLKIKYLIETRFLLNFTLAKLHYLCIYTCTFWLIQSCNPANPKTRYRCKLRANRIANGTIRPTIKYRHYKRSSPSSRLILYEDSSGLISFSRNAS